MLEAGLQQRLVADSKMAQLVEGRIYPLVWPSDTPNFPLVTYQRISTVNSYSLLNPVSIITVRMQFDCWAKTYSTVRVMSAVIAASFVYFSGALPDGTTVLSMTQDSCTDLYDSPTSTYRVTSDYLIQFRR